MKPIKLVNSYVYVVLEHSGFRANILDYDNWAKNIEGKTGDDLLGELQALVVTVNRLHADALVHGVYINEQEALGKRESLIYGKDYTPPKTTNYVAVLKKPLKGKERDAGDFLPENLKKVLMRLK